MMQKLLAVVVAGLLGCSMTIRDRAIVFTGQMETMRDELDSYDLETLLALEELLSDDYDRYEPNIDAELEKLHQGTAIEWKRYFRVMKSTIQKAQRLIKDREGDNTPTSNDGQADDPEDKTYLHRPLLDARELRVFRYKLPQ